MGLMPFGWVIVELDPIDSNPTPNALLAEKCRANGTYAQSLREELTELRGGLELRRAAAECVRRSDAEADARRTEEAAEVARLEAERLAAKAMMTPNLRSIEDFREFAARRLVELHGGKERPNEVVHNRVRQLAKAALESADWTASEKLAVALAIEEWLPKLVDRIDIKDERKKLKLSLLKLPS